MTTGSYTPDPKLFADFRNAVRRKIERDLEAEQSLAETLRKRARPAVSEGLRQAREEHLCGAAWLFGSYAWGHPSEGSDVDILAADCRDPMLVTAIVGRHTGTEVHVIPVESAPDSLRERVLQEGIPI